MAQEYFAIVTDIGKQKLLAHSLDDTKANVILFAVGDANGLPYDPTPDMTSLKNEVWRGDVNEIKIDPATPNMVSFRTTIDGTVGGFTIREMAIIDDEGDTIAIANTPAVEKTAVTSGAGIGINPKLVIIADNIDSINIEVDPNIAGATKQDLDDHNSDPEAHPFTDPDMPGVTSLAEAIAWVKANKVDKGQVPKYPITLAAGFTVAPTKECTFSKDDFGKVLVTLSLVSDAGKILSGTAGAVVTTLPEGYRPENRQDISLLYRTSGGVTGNYGWGYGIITTDGNIALTMFSGQTSLNTSQLYLDVQASFYTRE